LELTANEQDALAANCPDCWARPGKLCWIIVRGIVTERTRGHPHPNRIGRAERRGVLGGTGRLLLEQNRRIDG